MFSARGALNSEMTFVEVSPSVSRPEYSSVPSESQLSPSESPSHTPVHRVSFTPDREFQGRQSVPPEIRNAAPAGEVLGSQEALGIRQRRAEISHPA